MTQGIKKHSLLILLVLLNIFFAILWGGDFGDSYDEAARYEYALESIDRFSRLESNPNIGDKGPIYLVVAKLGGDLIQLINPGLSNIQAWHFIHFFTFLLAVVGFYSISLQFLSPGLAFVTTALFNTQPLLFGHAFINPKDIPFMALFLLTIATGLHMVNQLKSNESIVQNTKFLSHLNNIFQQDWSKLNLFKKALNFLVFIPLIILAVLKIRTEWVQGLLLSGVNNLDQSWITRFLNKLAQLIFQGDLQNGISLHNVRTVYPYLSVLTLLSLMGLIFLLLLFFFPKSFRYLSGFRSLKELGNDLVFILKNKWVYLAGFVLGFSITNRSLGIAAGGSILAYLWVKQRERFLAASMGYLGFSFIVVYLTWPGLWVNPILGILKSVLRISSFSWGGKVLFLGETISPDALPSLYFPTLMTIQFTIPALLLFLLGSIEIVRKWRDNKYDPALFILIATWFVLPLLAITILKPTIYDNFRHFLFITPPLFLIAGVGIQFLVHKLNNKLLSAVLILFILAPGVFGIIILHPYPYIYYNEFVGGVDGAFRKFETDYWYTSYVECIEYINQEVPLNKTVLVSGPAHIIESYARDDLSILEYRENDAAIQVPASDYLIVSSRGNKDLELLPDAEVIYTVEKAGAILAEVRKLK